MSKKVISKKNLEKKYFLMPSSRSLTKRKKQGAGSVSQRFESVDPNPNQNVTDPEHWKYNIMFYLYTSCCRVMY